MAEEKMADKKNKIDDKKSDAIKQTQKNISKKTEKKR